jgi:hypothetical protein
MPFLHAVLAPFEGTARCYEPLLLLIARTQSVMIQMNREIEPLILPYLASGKDLIPSVEEQIRDFLDGKTHGESLLHALYDDVLDEPVPDQMRGLFR